MSTEKKRKRYNSEERIDKLIELVDAVARVDTKMDAFCKDTLRELMELKKEVQTTGIERSKIKARVEQLEKDLIRAQNERTEWKSEFEKWKWRLGVIAPTLTVIITTIVLYFLNQIWNIF